jgi:uncharacterized protein
MTTGGQNARLALITGASRGIGYELARVCAERGHDLVLVARSAERLQEVAAELGRTHGIRATPLPLDLARPEAPAALFAELQARGLQVDILINNAGFASYGPFAETDLEEELDELQLNVVTTTHLTKPLLRPMLERRWGRVLNVASTAAFQPGPYMAVYYATKAYILSFSEAIDSELEGTGVSVTCLCPGPTRTAFQERADIRDSPLARLRRMEPGPVAEAGYRAMMAGRAVVIPGLRDRLLALGAKFGPRGLVTRIAGKMQRAGG